MKKINLQNILSEKLGNENLPINTAIKEAMKEACKQTLELAAENAITMKKKIDYTGVRAGGYYIIDIVDKQSILDTINQIK